MRTIIDTTEAPAAIGPYSQAVSAAGLLFCAGQIALDPRTGELVTGGPAAQATRCLESLAAICRAAGTDLRRAVRLTVFLTNMDTFTEVNDAYATFFEAEPPARVTIGVAALPRGAAVEIDAIVETG